MKPRIVEYWTNIDSGIGAAVADGLGLSSSPNGSAPDAAAAGAAAAAS
jgi:hypothetical protein